jgi:mRNA-degrading endonuclease toxin of MazEF toxin-antitoxin module
VVNCGDLFTIDKRRIARPRGSLGPAAMAHLREALAIALELD